MMVSLPFDSATMRKLCCDLVHHPAPKSPLQKVLYLHLNSQVGYVVNHVCRRLNIKLTRSHVERGIKNCMAGKQLWGGQGMEICPFKKQLVWMSNT